MQTRGRLPLLPQQQNQQLVLVSNRRLCFASPNTKPRLAACAREGETQTSVWKGREGEPLLQSHPFKEERNKQEGEAAVFLRNFFFRLSENPLAHPNGHLESRFTVYLLNDLRL